MKTINWMVGEASAETINHFTNELHKKTLSKFNAKNGTVFDTYSPWMCIPNPTKDIINLIDSKLENIVTDRQYLLNIQNIFSKSVDEPLGLFDLDNEHLDLQLFIPPDLNTENVIRDAFLVGINLVQESNSFFKAILPSVAKTILPLKVKNSDNSRAAFSSHLAKGAIFRAVPDLKSETWRIDLAVDLVHELGHQVLINYQAADRILKSSFEKKLISGVRKVYRPAIMCFHAAAALAYMVTYLRSQELNSKNISRIEKEYVNFELSRYKSDLFLANKELEKCEFTRLGDQIFTEFKRLTSS